MKRGYVRLFLLLSIVWAIAYSIHAVSWYRERRADIGAAELEMAKLHFGEGVSVVARSQDGTVAPVVIGEYVQDMRVGEHPLRVPIEVAQCFKSAQSPPSHFGLVREQFGIEQILVLDEFGGKIADAGYVTYSEWGAKPEADPANECATEARSKLAGQQKAQRFERRFALWRTMAWQFALGILAIAALVAMGAWVLRGFAREPTK